VIENGLLMKFKLSEDFDYLSSAYDLSKLNFDVPPLKYQLHSTDDEKKATGDYRGQANITTDRIGGKLKTFITIGDLETTATLQQYTVSDEATPESLAEFDATVDGIREALDLSPVELNKSQLVKSKRAGKSKFWLVAFNATVKLMKSQHR